MTTSIMTALRNQSKATSSTLSEANRSSAGVKKWYINAAKAIHVIDCGHMYFVTNHFTIASGRAVDWNSGGTIMGSGS